MKKIDFSKKLNKQIGEGRVGLKKKKKKKKHAEGDQKWKNQNWRSGVRNQRCLPPKSQALYFLKHSGNYTNVAANQTRKLGLFLPLLLPWKWALPTKLLVTKHCNTEPGTNRYSGLFSVFCQQLLEKRNSVFHYHLLSVIWLCLISGILYVSRIGGRPK